MPHDNKVIGTKISAPRPARYTLARPRIDAALRQSLHHRLTLVQAGTGYGKSTALAHLMSWNLPLFWYCATEGDSDLQQFLVHLIAAFRQGLGTLPDVTLALSREGATAQDAVDLLLNNLSSLLTRPSLLVIDDYHLAESPRVDALAEHFLGFLPSNMHVIVSTRHLPTWEKLVVWRARGELYEINSEALAFTQDEIEALFRTVYGLALAPLDVAALRERTEGWPIALQLVWQKLRANPKTDVTALVAQAGSLDTLFEYLTHQVIAKQTREVQDFLLRTSVLRELDAPACDAIAGRRSSHALLAHLRDNDLFVVSLGDGRYRYHHLFHTFLREQALRRNASAVLRRHRRAGEFYHRRGDSEEAVYHWLSAQSYESAVDEIEQVAENLLRAGRLDTLAAWIDSLPPPMVTGRPLLMFYLGDVARLRGRFDDALAWYQHSERLWRGTNDTAGTARALRGQALVHLDEVEPAQAEGYLQEALRLTDGLHDRSAQARLLELLAENKLNMGKGAEAEQLRLQAAQLRDEGPSEDMLSVRVKLRTGQLDQARALLETWARDERGKPHSPRGHRETLLLLSLIYSIQGCADDALRAAQEGMALSHQLQLPFLSAVGHMRSGHALLVQGNTRAALDCYQQAITLGNQLSVPRVRVEASLGTVRAHGFSGDLNAARRDAAEGITIGRRAGDAWATALVTIELGASMVRAGESRQAIDALGEALSALRSCGDTFGRAVARLWLALGHWQLRQRERALADLDNALDLAQTCRYGYIFSRHTLLGLSDPSAVVPLLLEVKRRQGSPRAAYAAELLAEMGMEDITSHPGYSLKIQTLGGFRLWCGENEVTRQPWRRRKARELFELFVTRRGQYIERDEILDLLWRDQAPDSAVRNFKTTLNALNRVLEPARRANDPTAFIVRQETAYGLRRGADIWVDADEFADLLCRADEEPGSVVLARRALALYHGDFLPDARYTDWASAERERLLDLYLHGASKLAQELFSRGEQAECLALCEHILQMDRAWEHAYQLMMQIHARQGDRVLVRRTLDRCRRALREELDVEPSPATLEYSQTPAR